MKTPGVYNIARFDNHKDGVFSLVWEEQGGAFYRVSVVDFDTQTPLPGYRTFTGQGARKAALDYAALCADSNATARELFPEGYPL